MTEWILPAVFIFVFTALFLSLFKHMQSSKKALSKLKATFNGSVSFRLFYPIFKGQYQGLNFFIRLEPAGKHTPPCLVFCLSKECSATLKIYRESELSYIGKKIGLVREIKVNDEVFDSKYLIFSNNPQCVAAYLRNDDIKSTITKLFDDEFAPIIVDKKGITVRKFDYNASLDLSPENITNVLQKTNLIARGL